ncbi:MAG: LysR family transcriptional regulator [Myxococcota bacterium]
MVRLLVRGACRCTVRHGSHKHGVRELTVLEIRMNRLEAMEVFTRVAESGSFTAAARALGIPRASATTRVQALEARLGVKLLHRTTRRVSLTSEGAVYFEECRRLLQELAALEEGLGAALARPRGRLRVDAPVSAARHLLAPALPAFLAKNPEVVVDLGSTDRAVDLVAEGIDCVIRGGEVHDESLAARRLGALPVITCAAPAYLRKYGTPRSPRDLEGHHFVNYFSSRTGRIFEVDFARGDEQYTLHPPHRVAANDAETWIALAVAGLGLLQAPASPHVRRLIQEGKLKRVLKGWVAPPLPMTVLYPPSRSLPARVRTFIDWVVALYADEVKAAEAFVGGSRR